MIQLNCPQCDEQLEVDDGFAGGICRCYDCGTLMTVPAAKGGRAEQLKAAGRPSRPSRPTRPGEPVPEAPAGADEEVTTYVTETGKKVEVSKEQLSKVVVAGKARVGVRAGVILAFILFFGGIGTAIAILSYNVLKEADQAQKDKQNDTPANGGDHGPDVVIVQDPTNPLLIKAPNLLGLDMAKAGEGATIIIVDTSVAMVRSFEFVRAGLPINVKTLGSTSVQVMFAKGTGQTPFPEGPTPAGQWDHEEFAKLIDTIEAGGGQQLLDATQAAIERKPARIVLVFSEKPARQEITQIKAAIAAASVKLDIIKIGPDESSLRTLATEAGGRYHNVSDGDADLYLDEWRER